MHKIKNISSIAQPQLQAVSEEQNAPDTIKHIDDGENKIKKALLALATASIAALGMVIVFKNKGKIKPAQLADNTLNTLKDINFKNGIAHIKNSNDLFTGTITDKLKNGDLIELVYKDGIIQSSTRKGEKSFEKIYERLNDNKLSSIITYNDAKILSKSVCDDMGKIRFTTNKNGDINYIYDSKGNLSKVFKNNTSIARNFKHDADNRLTSYIKKAGLKYLKHTILMENLPSIT